ncbi:DUF2190 family protein [Celeribacter neptunius]|uniref:Predicted phage recombinase, RecA/RadA family n=1 Tax=Celeribacter neptunius TaxID=588602 RepID=A0A1I3TTI1_9RHOB|nr:DUF2190 family protein [Celeribacter neptunius]SFJ73920.1 Predicted phage recombinase, RecA/RadA family [Celeribacter neptunius]
MATNFIQPGDTLTIPAPFDVLSGGIVIAGNIVGIAQGDALAGADLDVKTSGVWTLSKVGADDIELGAPLYWDDSAELVTITATDNTRLGTAAEAAGASVGSVAVKLIQL